MKDFIDFQIQVATGRFTLPVAVGVCLALWTFTLHGWQDGAKLAGLAVVAYLMIEANTTFTLIRTRTTMPVCLWIALGSLLLFLPSDGWTWAVAPVFAMAVFQFFRGYESASAPVAVYNAFLALGAGSLALPFMVWYAPLFLVAMLPFRATGIKCMLAALLGLLTPYWFLFGYAFVCRQMEWLWIPLHRMLDFSPWTAGHLPMETIVPGAVITSLQVVFGIHYLHTAYTDKTRTRIYHTFLVYAGWWTLVCSLLQPVHWPELLPVQILCTAFLGGRLFTLTRNRFSGILFIVTFAWIIVLTVYNLWMHFFNS